MDSLNYTHLLQQREYQPELIGRHNEHNILTHMFYSCEFTIEQEIKTNSTVNSIALDLTRTLMLTGDATGNVFGYQVANANTGRLQECAHTKPHRISVQRVQWYPLDQSMFTVTHPTRVSVIDAVRFDVVDTYRFETPDRFRLSGDSASTSGTSGSDSRSVRQASRFVGKRKQPNVVQTGARIPVSPRQVSVHWSDWNRDQNNLIAIALGDSSVRIVDVRVGSAVQQIHVKSADSQTAHHVTRSLWAAHDGDALFLGDSAGFLHLFDMRRTRHALQSCEGISGLPIGTLQHTTDNHRVLVAHGHYGRSAIWTFRRKKLWLQPINLNPEALFPNFGSNSDYIHCQMALTDTCLIRPIEDVRGEVRIQSMDCGRTLNTFVSPYWTPDTGEQRSTCAEVLERNYVIVYSAGSTGIKVWIPAAKSDETMAMMEQVHADTWSDSD